MEIVTLDTVCEIGNGYAFKSDDYKSAGIPLLRISNINNGIVDFKEDKVCVSEDYLTSKKSFIVEKGDVVIALSGATTGKYGIYTSEFPALLNQRIGIIKSDNSKRLLSKYFYYYLNVLREQILNKAGGAAQPNISTKDIGKFEIPLPDLATQQKIAALLDKTDELRQYNKQLVEKYDALRQSLFLDMFGDPVRNEKGLDIKTIEHLVSNEKHSIKSGPFGSSLKKEFYVEKGYKIYGQEQVIKDDLSFGDYYIDEKKYKELNSCKIKEGDILISLVGTYGKIALVPKDYEPGIINPRLMKISPNQKIIRPDFLKISLQSSYVTKQLKSYSRGGTMDIINGSIIKKVTILLPPIVLQNQFAERVQLIEQQKELAQQALQKSEELFNSLLQKAFKGELVPEYEL